MKRNFLSSHLVIALPTQNFNCNCKLKKPFFIRGFMVLIISLLCSLTPLVAQQMDIEKLKKMDEKELKRYIEELKKDPNYKKAVQQRNKEKATQPKDTLGGRSTASFAFPKKNTTVLSSLKVIKSVTELRSYVSTLHLQLENGLRNDDKKSIASIEPSLLKNARGLGQLSVLCWYRGATEAAAVIAAKSVMLPSTGILEANNLGAMLVMGGLAEKAIPVLLFLHGKNSNDATILNNLGQAYAALGASDMAMNYLKKCLQVAPNHPEANYTVARIEAANGNKQLAIVYAKKSLEGGFTDGANHLLSKLNPPKEKLNELLSKIDLPDDFDAYKFELPRQQLLLTEGDQIIKEHEAFRRVVLATSSQLNDMVKGYEEKGKANMKEVENNPSLYSQNRYQYVRPLAALGMSMLNKYGEADYDNTLNEKFNEKIKELKSKYEKKKSSIVEEYIEKLKPYRDCGGQGRVSCSEKERLLKEQCVKLDAATSEYLAGKAEARIDWQTKRKNEALKVFFLTSKWGYLAGPDDNWAKASYYKAAAEYLSEINTIAQHDAAQYAHCKPHEDLKPRGNRFKFDFSGAECPFDIEVPMIVGELSINCEEASFGINAGAAFKFTQNFANKQSTLSLGIGLGKDLEFKEGGVEAKVEASVGQSLFICFDGHSNILDAGMKFGMGLSAGYGVKSNIKLDNISERMSEDGAYMGKGLGELNTSMGYSFGINSGFEFNEGPLKSLLNRSEKQVNPKVPIYQK
jgi:tetratricopeptide (TPR) repeat protein